MCGVWFDTKSGSRGEYGGDFVLTDSTDVSGSDHALRLLLCALAVCSVVVYVCSVSL